MGTCWIASALWNGREVYWTLVMLDGRRLDITHIALVNMGASPFGQIMINYWLRTAKHHVFH